MHALAMRLNESMQMQNKEVAALASINNSAITHLVMAVRWVIFSYASKN